MNRHFAVGGRAEHTGRYRRYLASVDLIKLAYFLIESESLLDSAEEWHQC